MGHNAMIKRKTKHTPTPWKRGGKYGEIEDARGYCVVEGCPAIDDIDTGEEVISRAEADANAEFIVRAVNSYADMLEALQTTYGVLWMLRELGETDLDEVIDMAKASINKATQEEVTQ